MPLEGPGRRQSVIATKACHHGDPAVELGLAGVAAKSEQIVPMVPSLANAAIAQQIAINEEFVIMLDGLHEVATSKLPAGAVVGDQLFIHPADNSLVKAADAGAGDVKFGVLVEIDVTLGRSQVNLTQRSSF